MKLTKKLVEQFEIEQKEHGTEAALYNVIWHLAADVLTDIGVTKLTTKDSKSVRMLKPEQNL
jgi:hypothetical protein